MKRKIRFLIATFISIIPNNSVRVFLYNTLFKYNIKNSKTGFGTVIFVSNCEINGAEVGSFNKFIGPFDLFIDSNTQIGSYNKFRCGEWVVSDKFSSMNFKHSFKIGKDCSIGDKHFFDVSGLIEIGDNSWIAGNGSQFWTHGGDKSNNDIVIGSKCYIGSGVKFAPGSGVADNTVVAMGSIINKKFKHNNSLISPPAMRVLKFESERNHIFDK